MYDILIIGAGPAALRIAAACAVRGMSVSCVAPEPRAQWLPRYGAWDDELSDLQLPKSCIEASWPQTVAFTPRQQDLQRGYVRLSTDGLQQHLLEKADDAGAHLQAGLVDAVEHHEAYSAVALRSGAAMRARVVVDATGHGSNFVRKAGDRPCAWQLAYGQLLRVPGGHPWDVGQMTLMDFRLPKTADSHWRTTPTFLYAMPIDDEHVFVEETSLIHTAPPDTDTLAERLALRLRWMGVHGEPLEEERCRIRMTGPAPVVGQRTLAYGAAAGMIHPATGYQLARLLREAPRVADAIAGGLGHSPQEAASAAWRTLWPAKRRRTWALYNFGAEILGTLNHSQTVAFFEAFFRLQPAQWQGFHSATLPPGGVARAMTAFFLSAPQPIRRRLVAASASRSGATLLRSVAWA